MSSCSNKDHNFGFQHFFIFSRKQHKRPKETRPLPRCKTPVKETFRNLLVSERTTPKQLKININNINGPRKPRSKPPMKEIFRNLLVSERTAPKHLGIQFIKKRHLYRCILEKPALTKIITLVLTFLYIL